MLLWCACGATVLIGMAYGVFFSKWLVVSRVSIEGNKKTQSVDIRAVVDGYMSKKLFSRIPRNTFFLVMPKDLQKTLDKRFSELAAVWVVKTFPNRLAVRVREREFSGIWCGTSSACFLMDTEGVLYGEAPSSSGTLVLTVRGSEVGSMGSAVVSTSVVASLAHMHNLTRTQFNLAAAEFDIRNLPDVAARITDGWELRFDALRKPQETLDALRETLAWITEKQKGEGVRKELEYIDLRIEGRAYYKFKGNDATLKPET